MSDFLARYYSASELIECDKELIETIKEQKAQIEAEKIKSTISDDTINKLAKYVHEVLGLSNLNCNYDINQEKCRNCIKRKGKIC